MQALYDYNRWANLRLLDAAAILPREQFAVHVTSSFSSLRDTFAHIAGVEFVTIFRQLGAAAPGTDYLLFAGESR